MSSRVKELIAKVNGWATRSLLVGVGSTLLDQGTSLFLRFIVELEVRPASMIGTALGATFSFLMNRKFAFTDTNSSFGATALRFALVTSLQVYVHGHIVNYVVQRSSDAFLPFAKMIADLCVFTFLQLLVLRYIVFPKGKPKEAAPPS